MNKTGQTSISNFYMHTVAKGGGTFDTRQGRVIHPTAGYAVSISGGVQLPLSRPDKIRAFHSVVRLLAQRVPFVGTWIDKGIMYIDATLIVSSIEDAMRIAKENKQQAIYNFAEAKVINVTADEAVEVSK